MWTRLPLEIHRMIFELIDESQDLLALLTVCKALRFEVENLLYRVVVLKTDQSYPVFFSAIVARPGLALQVHTLSFFIPTICELFHLALFGQALGLLDKLQSLTINHHSHGTTSHIARHFSQILDSASVKFQLSTFRDRTFSLWLNPGNQNIPSDFIKNQHELRDIQLPINATHEFESSALPRLDSVFTNICFAKENALQSLLQNRSITRLAIMCTSSTFLKLPPMPSLQVLSILDTYVPRLRGLSELFPLLRVLECKFMISIKEPFLDNIRKLENLTILTLVGVIESWRYSSFEECFFNGLIEDIFSCNGSLSTLDFATEASLYGHAIYPVVSFKRGENPEDGSKEQRTKDDWRTR